LSFFYLVLGLFLISSLIHSVNFNSVCAFVCWFFFHLVLKLSFSLASPARLIVNSNIVSYIYEQINKMIWDSDIIKKFSVTIKPIFRVEVSTKVIINSTQLNQSLLQ